MERFSRTAWLEVAREVFVHPPAEEGEVLFVVGSGIGVFGKEIRMHQAIKGAQ